MDQIDGIKSHAESEATRRMKVEFLVQMSRPREGLYVIGATDRPWDVCPAVRKRFEQRLFVGLPDLHERENLFKGFAIDLPNELSDEDWTEMSILAAGYSGLEILTVVREANFMPVRTVRETLADNLHDCLRLILMNSS